MWKPGAREIAQRPGVVVVQVGDDHVLDARRVDADARERLGRQPRHRAVAAGRLGVVEAGVDDDSTVRIADDPHEEVDGHRRVVRVDRLEEVLLPLAFGSHAVAEREDFVGFLTVHWSMNGHRCWLKITKQLGTGRLCTVRTG